MGNGPNCYSTWKKLNATSDIGVFYFIAVDTIIIIASFVLYSLLVEYARGMNVTGCHNHCSIQLSDFLSSDSLIFYLPAFCGLFLILIGLSIHYRRKK